MKKMVKTCMPLAMLLLICFGTPAASQQYSSVTDTIRVISREAEPISCIGIYDEKNRSLSPNQLSSSTEENSACSSNHIQALYRGAADNTAEFGGYLKFSLFGYPDTDFSITASLKTLGYQSGEVEMSVGTMKSSGSDVSTLGTAVPEFSKSSWEVLDKEPRTLVYGIDGTRTWTGSAAVDGIQVYYRFASGRKPYNFTVIYSLIKEDR